MALQSNFLSLIILGFTVAQEALRRGWYLGEDTFRDRLLALMDKAQGIKTRVSRKAEALEKDYLGMHFTPLATKCRFRG